MPARGETQDDDRPPASPEPAASAAEQDGAVSDEVVPKAVELEPEQVVTGIEREGREPGDLARGVGNVLLFVPRNVIDLVFRGTSAAAGLIADEQLVPRYRELLGAPPGGDVFVFPTVFAETGGPFSVGLRMLADTEDVATSQRFGFGGLNDVVVESRILFKGGREYPYAVSLEAFYELEGEVEYHGVGLEPSLDERNRFRPTTSREFGLYEEKQIRGLGSLGMRLTESFEFFLSASLQRRQIRDSEDVGDEALSQVFEPGSISGVSLDTWIGYAEMAARFDSRRYRTKPSPGVLLEAYTGGAHDTEGDDVAFMRVGWRIGAFIPVYRETNILAPRLVIDRLLPLGELEVPFAELPRQPDFRGFDTRRDRLSLVGSVDYTWQLVPFMGMRLFLDAASVAPSAADLSLETFKNLRYAGGLGLDLFTETAEIGRFAVATSPEGVRVLLTLGAPEGHGDRQHRE